MAQRAGQSARLNQPVRPRNLPPRDPELSKKTAAVAQETMHKLRAFVDEIGR